MSISWEKTTEEKFQQMIAKVPIFLRDLARDKVSQKAENLVKAANRQEITEKDIVDAFFAETPFGFHGPMKCDMETLGIDYIKHGYTK